MFSQIIYIAVQDLLAVITQAGLIGRLTRRFRETWLIISGLWMMGISLLAWAVSFAYRRIVIPTRRARLEAGVEGSHA